MKDDQPICATCGKPMELEEQTDSSASWICPNGHHHHELVVGDSIRARGAHQTHYQSGKTVRERPAVEARDYSDFCDRTGGWEEEHTPKGTRITQRGTEPRDSSGPFEGREAEIQAVRRFLGQYNKEHGTDYERPTEANEHDPPDFTVYSPSGLPPLHIEHTRISKGDEPFRPLRKNGEVEVSHKSSEELRRIIIQAIEKKENKYECRDHSDWVLLLDARLPMSEERLTELQRVCAQQLRESGFGKIWYVDRAPSPIIKQLK